MWSNSKDLYKKTNSVCPICLNEMPIYSGSANDYTNRNSLAVPALYTKLKRVSIDQVQFYNNKTMFNPNN